MQTLKVPARGGEPIPVAGLENARDVQESPDGRSLFFQRDEAVWRMSVVDRSAVQVLNRRISHFSLTREGVYFQPSGGRDGRIEYFDFATRDVKIVLMTERMVVGEPSVAADERSLLYTQVDGIGADLVLVEHFR
jgi:hypothetical protein